MTEPEDPLDALRARIHATQEAAEALAAEAAEARADQAAGRVPPMGWRSAEEQDRRTSEVQALVALLETLRELVPDELIDQVREVIRQLLLLVRALIDWWVERMDARPAPHPGGEAGHGTTVQDIPIA